jgi:GT2 family glycosyltransferase
MGRVSGRAAKVPVISQPTSGTLRVTEFGEEAYREAFPDINAAINDGALDSAAAHFRRHGRAESRLTSSPYLQALVGRGEEMPASGVGLSIDAALVSHNGTILVVGWIDDRAHAMRSLSVIQGAEGANTRSIARCRRSDVDSLLDAGSGFSFGFWIVLKPETPDIRIGPTLIRARLADGSFEQREVQITVSSDVDLRETILGHFATLQYYGNRDIEAFNNLETGIGLSLTRFNRTISGSITASVHAEYYGPRRSRFKASLIVCLFGKIEYFFLQNALFRSTVGIEDYEFIYVSNSPDMAEALQKEARAASAIYGLSVTMVTLPGNGGFSAANNAAARFAKSDRLIFINPDVFPRDRLWAQKHEALLDTLPREQTALFGVPLYYDDGSLMHGGMHFEVDQGLSVKTNSITTHGMVRVEHYGKGAPAWSNRYTRSRPVPAVTGAFVSTDREWFQSLGGFTEDYIFGHYEDADLCLKSLRQGVPAWMHDLRFWHLEGKGSTRRPPHEGGSLVNRWLFTRRWGDMITASIDGASPTHPLLQLDGLSAGGQKLAMVERPSVAAPPMPLPSPPPPVPDRPVPGPRSRRAGRPITSGSNG